MARVGVDTALVNKRDWLLVWRGNRNWRLRRLTTRIRHPPLTPNLPRHHWRRRWYFLLRRHGPFPKRRLWLGHWVMQLLGKATLKRPICDDIVPPLPRFNVPVVVQTV
jgi:hypothetical protein